MKILVLCEDYPSAQNPYAMSYVHTRNLEYAQKGHDVSVINYRTRIAYAHEGISVLTGKSPIDGYDVIVSHAPNIKNHLRQLVFSKNQRLAFFFHGHEVLKGDKDYPKPFPWMRPTLIQQLTSTIYNEIKIPILKHWLKYTAKRNRIGLVFVSNWMQAQFEKNMSCTASSIAKNAIIPNAVGRHFIERHYTPPKEPAADCITIRPLDQSKYAIDLVIELALKNPNIRFHVFGKGRYFELREKPPNVEWIDQFIHQRDLPETLDRYRTAIMPTRYDAQGVMMCEMASYGIPLITSDIGVCQEMLNGYTNVQLQSNDNFAKAKLPWTNHVETKENLNRFNPGALADREIAFFNEL